MAEPTQYFEPGTLWKRILEQTERGLARGALQPIATKAAFVEQGGVRFLVRVVANLAKKEAQRSSDPFALPGAGDFNPFLPYDPDLYVAHVAPHHVCLLNKYNVVEHHLLIVTEAFEHQLSLLTPEDFQALSACMREFSSLGFYNAGEVAGASQRHKHLQLVPLPLAPAGPDIPIQPLFGDLPPGNSIGRSSALPFSHALARAPTSGQSLQAAAAAMHSRYLSLMRALDLVPADSSVATGARTPYNLLVGAGFMLVVPRSRECLQHVSVNALGFAGALLVRNEDELAHLRSLGPLAVLQHVGCPLETA